MQTKPTASTILLIISMLFMACSKATAGDEVWRVDTAEEWQQAIVPNQDINLQDGSVSAVGKSAIVRSNTRSFKKKRSASALVITQSPVWQNWTAVGRVSPSNLRDAPVYLTLGPGNYWIFGRYGKSKKRNFQAEEATLEGFEVPLKTTPFPNQYDAPGGLKPSLGGYHAWQSRDMVNWVHHGPVSDERARWVTTAEHIDGKTYIYYDFPNDQDPHLLIDQDLTDGVPGEDMGMAFKDPSDGSDCAVIRDRAGRFHLIYEDWSPINAGKHSWDSPLAGHAVSKDGKGGFEIQDPAVDERTSPTGVFKEFAHPHWYRDDPDNYVGKPDEKGSMRAFSRYEVHEPEQDAYGDWASISVGGQYYLFADFHPAGTTKSNEMQIAWFTSPKLGTPFEFCDSIGSGHPDPDIGFAEGQFYLFNQTRNDYISPGPWVESVELRVGVDTSGDGQIDTWSDWKEVRESYDYVPGFSKQVSTQPASMDLSQLPEGYGFSFELRIEDSTENASTPIIDSVTMQFE
ncbi:MAG: hypothetical protein ACPGSB_04640 [Opitutales bacterium]